MHALTSLDVREGVYEDQYKLSDTVKPLRPHVQDTVVGIIVERVPAVNKEEMTRLLHPWIYGAFDKTW